jgi:hypothetical protein
MQKNGESRLSIVKLSCFKKIFFDVIDCALEDKIIN